MNKDVERELRTQYQIRTVLFMQKLGFENLLPWIRALYFLQLLADIQEVVLELSELRQKRVELEFDLGQRIKAFEDATGVSIGEDLKYNRFYAEQRDADTRPCVETDLDVGYNDFRDSDEPEDG